MPGAIADSLTQAPIEMEMELSESVRTLVWFLLSRLLNILISPGGQGELARPGILDDNLPDLEGIRFRPLEIGILLSAAVLPRLIRYTLGHVAPTLLILQASQQNEAVSEKTEVTSKQHCNFRDVRDSFRLIYLTQGVYTFIRAIVIGLVYLFVRNLLQALLSWLIFRHKLLSPLSCACSSALLSGVHLTFTCATVSARGVPFRSLLRRSGHNRRKMLAIPAFSYGLSEAIMGKLFDFVEMALLSPEARYTSKRATAEVLAVMAMLGFRLLAVIPTYITLVQAELAFLAPELETAVPSPTKERGLNIEDLIGEKKPPVGFAALDNISRSFGTATFLYLIELHLKKCAVHIVVELSLFSLLTGVAIASGGYLEAELGS